MAADYLVSSLAPVVFDAPAPSTAEVFLARCREQLSGSAAEAIAAVFAHEADPAAAPVPVSHPLAARWFDLDAELRNAAALERNRLAGRDSARGLRPAHGCSLQWTARIVAAFQEKDPAAREKALDRVRWDAAGELTPPAEPLSAAALFTYAIRLAISLRRERISTSTGNEVFTRLTTLKG